MARDSLSIENSGKNVAVNGSTGYFVYTDDDGYEVESLSLAPWETMIGPKCIVSW